MTQSLNGHPLKGFGVSLPRQAKPPAKPQDYKRFNLGGWKTSQDPESKDVTFYFPGVHFVNSTLPRQSVSHWDLWGQETKRLEQVLSNKATEQTIAGTLQKALQHGKAEQSLLDGKSIINAKKNTANGGQLTCSIIVRNNDPWGGDVNPD